MFIELYKFSKLVMHLNSCSMDLGRETCSIQVLGKVLNRFLQSDKSGSKVKLAAEFLNRCTIAKASNSTMRFSIPKKKARFNPSRSAQSFATQLVVNPTPLAKPPSHFPSQLWRRPSQLALLRFPIADPSVLRVVYPTEGLFQATWMTALQGFDLLPRPIAKNYALFFTQEPTRFGSTTPDLKIKAFLCSHRCQIPIGKRISQGIPQWLEGKVLTALALSQSRRGIEKELRRGWGTLSFVQNSLAYLQSCNIRMMDSEHSIHNKQKVLRMKPLEPKISQVGILLWPASQKKKLIQGFDLIF